MKLKERYKIRWQVTVKRELLFECLMRTTPFTVKRTGLGTGSSELTNHYHRSPEEKFDYVIEYLGKRIAIVDVTGGLGYPPWVQLSKIYYAERYGLLSALWIAWLDPRRYAFYFINGERAKNVEGSLITIEGEPTPYKEIKLKYWITWRKWIQSLLSVVGQHV